jgi:hypothetical protein
MTVVAVEFRDYGVYGEYGFLGKHVATLDATGLTADERATEVAAMTEVLGEHVVAVEVELVGGVE